MAAPSDLVRSPPQGDEAAVPAAHRSPDAVAPPPGNPRFPLFDGLRALAALSILVFHTAAATGASVGEGGLSPYLLQLNVGVAIFFAISGFLLYRPFVAAKVGDAPAVHLGQYARRRFLRIVPAYWVALTILAVSTRDSSGGPRTPVVDLLRIWPGLQPIHCDRGTWRRLVSGLRSRLLRPAPGDRACVGIRRVEAWAPDLVAAGAVRAARLGPAQLRMEGICRLPTRRSRRRTLGPRLAGSRSEWRWPWPASSSAGALASPSAWRVTRGWVGAGRGGVLGVAADRPSGAGHLHHTPTVLGPAVYVLSGVVAFGVILPAAFERKPAGLLGRILALGPWRGWGSCRATGFLYHLPIATKLNGGVTTSDATVRFLWLTAATTALAIAAGAASYYVIERPVLRFKERRIGRVRRASVCGVSGDATAGLQRPLRVVGSN